MLERMIRRVRGGDAEAGFTLIELLVVIVILGVLAAVVVVSVSFITDRGTNSACKTDVQTVQSALEEYYAAQSQANQGDYPHDTSGATGTDPFSVLHNDGYISNANVTGTLVTSNPPTWSWLHNGYTITYIYNAATTGNTPTPASVTVTGKVTGASGNC